MQFNMGGGNSAIDNYTYNKGHVDNGPMVIGGGHIRTGYVGNAGATFNDNSSVAGGTYTNGIDFTIHAPIDIKGPELGRAIPALPELPHLPGTLQNLKVVPQRSPQYLLVLI